MKQASAPFAFTTELSLARVSVICHPSTKHVCNTVTDTRYEQASIVMTCYRRVLTTTETLTLVAEILQTCVRLHVCDVLAQMCIQCASLAGVVYYLLFLHNENRFLWS